VLWSDAQRQRHNSLSRRPQPLWSRNPPHESQHEYEYCKRQLDTV
jgi:hypothetical protein